MTDNSSNPPDTVAPAYLTGIGSRPAADTRPLAGSNSSTAPLVPCAVTPPAT